VKGAADAKQVLDVARQMGWRIAVAESCTGGLLSTGLTEISGSSDVFECGYITYSNAAKTFMLGVSEATIQSHGAVSEQVAREMADGALRAAGVDLTVSITGIAGPGGSEHKPEGRVCFAVSRKGAATQSETCEFGALGRANVRQTAMLHALKLLKDACKAA
jgi:nicotinamide-nucleotide amidase